MPGELSTVPQLCFKFLRIKINKSSQNFKIALTEYIRFIDLTSFKFIHPGNFQQFILEDFELN